MCRAQSAPDRSSRTLFNAYEEVLAEEGLGPQDDSVLHRFLFRMQADRRQGEELMERFQRTLGALDISFKVREEGEGIEVSTELDEAAHAEDATGGRHERRGSFESFFDGSADKIAGSTDGGPHSIVHSRSGSHGAARVGEANRWKKWRSRSDTDAPSYTHAQLPIRARVNERSNRRTASEQNRPRHRRGTSASSRGSLHIRRNGQTGTSQFTDYDADDSEHTDATADLDISNIRIPGVNAPIPDVQHERVRSYVPEPYHPSDTRLMDDAALFEEQRLHSLGRRCMQKWRDRTQECIQKQQAMSYRAVAFDRRILLRQSWDTLVEEARRRRSNHETERFFAHLERRAEKARDLFLLTKAFTHWANSAHDEVQRTSVARRHILRTKFFNGWREITAVNELKVQHFALAKFLDKWRRRTAQVRARQEFAVQLYDENVLRRYYKDWFFKFCNIAAPAWHNVRLKKVTFEKWHEITTVMKDRELWATDRRDRLILKRLLDVWKQRVEGIQALEPQALAFRRRADLTVTLSTLRKEAQLAPLLAQFRTKVDARIIRSALTMWKHNTRLSRQSRNVDRLRVLRNAWTSWNDRLRIKALEERINDRILIECMYRWTLASRVSLFQRVHDRNIKASLFSTWVLKTNEQRNTLESAEKRFSQFKRAQLLRSCLRKIESATAERRAEQYAVTAGYEQKLKRRIFTKLLDKHEHFQQLDRWAGDAQFYILATRSIKTWNEVTQHSRRNRRRETYSQVRRMVKTNLVKKMIGIWKNKARDIANMEEQANEIVRSRTLQLAPILLNDWHDRTLALLNREADVLQQRNDRLKLRYLNAWARRMATLRTMNAQAVALRQESTEITAAGALKKFGWRLWNARRQEENALALHQRNFEKHQRAMIRFWYEQTRERVAQRPVSPTPRLRSRGGARSPDDGTEQVDDQGEGAGDANLSDAGDDTRRLEAWTAFDSTALGLADLDLDLSLSPQPAGLASSSRLPPPPIPEDLAFDDPATFWSSTPMPPSLAKPGYLKTPSKRSVARSKRPELPPSPEKRAIGLQWGGGVMSAPPGAGARRVGGIAGVTSFEMRLREGGFGGGGTGNRGRGGAGKGRVGFGDVSRIG